MYSLAKDSIYVQPFPHEAVHAAATLQFSETSIILRGGQTKSQDHQGLRHSARRSGCQTSRLMLSVKLALGSSKIRADIVRLSPDPKNETLTYETWGLKTIGQPFVFPTHWKPREHNGFLWDGRLDSGSYAPPGTYKFVVRALRINGDERKKED
ncbi:hypothetical protein E4U14_005003 [Claviceps sp. LM454 group G7]|nr:hypothetical protein E4U14_005003 [Claviceps sp. LM454 group G7]